MASLTPLSDKDKKKVEGSLPGLEEMLKAGVHFGHRTSRWSPRMEPYIFTSRNDVHIIDLEKARAKLAEALEFLRQLKVNGKKNIVLVGTKISAKEVVRQTAEELGLFHVADRWIGGTLTNFKVLSGRLKHFRELEQKKESGELKKYTKKEQHEFAVELQRLKQQFGGLKQLTDLPDALVVVDIHKEKLAVREARACRIPVVGICDTNADPNEVDYAIVANDDAISSLRLILGAIAGVLKD